LSTGFNPMTEGLAMTQPAKEAADGRTRGALRELADDPSDRKRFLRMMGGAGAASAFAIFVAACGDDDEGSTSGASGTTKTNSESAMAGDLEIVQYALTLEHLETDFYNAVIDAGVIKDKALAETAKMIRDNEQEHVDALTGTVEQLGGKAKRPKTNFDAVLEGGPEMVLKTAATVENLGAAAYLGQAGRIKSKEILAAALAIHSVEARHAAALNTVVGMTIVPDGAFAKPASMEEVLPKVKPFLA
jgi:rubrerythrin